MEAASNKEGTQCTLNCTPLIMQDDLFKTFLLKCFNVLSG